MIISIPWSSTDTCTQGRIPSGGIDPEDLRCSSIFHEAKPPTGFGNYIWIIIIIMDLVIFTAVISCLDPIKEPWLPWAIFIFPFIAEIW